MSCPPTTIQQAPLLPSCPPTRYEWTLDATGLEDMTVTEELVEWLAQTRGYVHHPSITPNNETPDSTTSATSTSHGKTIDRGGKRASETNDHGGKRVSKDVATSSTASTHGSTCVIGHSSPCWHNPQWVGPLPLERARNQIVADRLANAAQLEPSNDPPSVAGCEICGGVDPMYGGTISCP